jgi:hypothetical protein
MLTETLNSISFSVTGRCSLVLTCNWLQGKCARINLSQAASGMIYRITGGFLYAFLVSKFAALGSLKRVTESIFKISNNFKEAS